MGDKARHHQPYKTTEHDNSRFYMDFYCLYTQACQDSGFEWFKIHWTLRLHHSSHVSPCGFPCKFTFRQSDLVLSDSHLPHPHSDYIHALPPLSSKGQWTSRNQGRRSKIVGNLADPTKFFSQVYAIVKKNHLRDPVVESSGLKIECNTRRFMVEDTKELLFRAEVQNRVYKRQIEAIDAEMWRLEKKLLGGSTDSVFVHHHVNPFVEFTRFRSCFVIFQTGFPIFSFRTKRREVNCNQRQVSRVTTSIRAVILPERFTQSTSIAHGS